MNKKITIVTAFFPLNRENWEGFERDNKKYLDYFEFWSRIQNDMIIYTDKKSKKYIEDIRIKKHKRNNTKIIIIDDYRKVDEELYSSILNVSKIELSKKFRLFENNPESWNADYNYVMQLKAWCCYDAVKNNYAKGTIAWIDFGYSHGGEYYTNPEDFDFLWDYNFSDKLHIFQINEFDKFPIFETIRILNTYITGANIVAPDYMWEEIWKSQRNNMLYMNKFGFMDDDQIFYYMFYLEYPEKVELHKGSWFNIFESCSNKKFSIIKTKPRKETKYRKFRNKIHHKKIMLKYAIKWYKIMCKEDLK